MSDPYPEASRRADEYARRQGVTLEDRAGYGNDGIVFTTDCHSAVKAFRYEPQYVRERDVYRRLQEYSVVELEGFAVPQLVRYADDFWVIEMTIVSAPRILDFAGAYLDERPDFPDETLLNCETESREIFGDRWRKVRSLMASFAWYGIYLPDVKPDNIAFSE